MIKVSVVVPVYNAAKSLGELQDRLMKTLMNAYGDSFEIVYVNDGSKDDSWQVLQAIKGSCAHTVLIDLVQNSGQHSALLCGLRHTTGEYVVTIDDDLQHSPEEIPGMVSILEDNRNFDAVIGVFDNKQHSAWRKAGSNIMKYLGRIIFKSGIKEKFTSFRCLRGNIAQAIADVDVINPRIGVSLIKITQRIYTMPVKHTPRKHGKSGYNLITLLRDGILNVINNSTLPLKMVSALGFMIFIVSGVFALYVVYMKLFHGSSVKGWSSLAVMISFYSGLILFTLGIIGEYLMRILLETRKYPSYVIREIQK